MSSWKRVRQASCGVAVLAAIGCVTNVGVGQMAPIADQDSLVRQNVVIEAAVLPSGDRSKLSVVDYHLPAGDGKLEIKVPWSETKGSVARYASINFPSASFGAGPKKVEVAAFHYKRCRLEAFDRAGALVSAADHNAGEKITQKLVLKGQAIARVDIIGAEIGIVEIGYEP